MCESSAQVNRSVWCGSSRMLGVFPVVECGAGGHIDLLVLGVRARAAFLVLFSGV